MAAILLAAFTLFALNTGVNETRSKHQLADEPEQMQMTEILRRMNQGANELNVQLTDGRTDCSAISYWETSSAILPKEYRADVLITSDDGSIVLFSHYKGTPSCADIGAKPVVGIITRMEKEAQAAMYATDSMGIRRYPNATLFRFCGDCTKTTVRSAGTTFYWLSAFAFIGFLFSLYLQWRRWTGHWEL